MTKHNPNSGIKNRKAYNNGTKVIYLRESDIVPEGFVKGGLSNRTKEQIEDIARKSRETQKLAWQNKSNEEKLAWSDKCKRAQANLSEEAKKIKYEKYLVTLSNKSKEELDAIRAKRRLGNIKAWARYSKQEREEIAKRIVARGGGWNKDTIKATIKRKYGCDNISQVSCIKERAKQSIVSTNMTKYGFKWNCQLPQCIKAIGSKSSNTLPNKMFANLLDLNNLKYEKEFPILNRIYDFKVNNYLIEINPFATHNSTWGLFNKDGLRRDYHYTKTLLAKTNGYRCINVFDWDDTDKIINLLKPRDTLYARKCSIKEVSLEKTRDYLNKYHLQNYTKDTIRLGLYYNDELVSIMTFSKPRYNKKFDYELVRFCSHKNIIGGPEKLFKYFIKKYNPNSIISYCDYSKFSGDTYLKLNFKFKRVVISKHWYNPKTKQHILDSSLNKLGYDRLFNTSFGKGFSNKDLMIQSGFVEIYDAGQATYVWENK